MKWITKDQVIFLHSELISRFGGTDGLRDEALLDSALNAPLQSFDGVDLFSDTVDKIVRLGYGIIRNHPFLDGNKRIGAHLMLVMLSLNGIELTYKEQELVDIIIAVAAGIVTEQELHDWIESHRR